MLRLLIKSIIVMRKTKVLFGVVVIVNDSGFISVVYARTVYENFSFFSGENFGYVLLDQI